MRKLKLLFGLILTLSVLSACHKEHQSELSNKNLVLNTDVNADKQIGDGPHPYTVLGSSAFQRGIKDGRIALPGSPEFKSTLENNSKLHEK